MENSCWKCGSALHHARECNQITDVRAKKDITGYRNAVTHLNKAKEKMDCQWQKNLQKRELFDSVPVFTVAKKEANRLSEKVHSIKLAADDLNENLISTDVGVLETKLESIQKLRADFSSEFETIRYFRVILKTAKKSWGDDEEVIILLGTMEYVTDTQTTLNDELYRILSQLKTALSFLDTWKKAADKCTTFMDDGIEAYNGRPLRIAAIKQEWKLIKAELIKLEPTYKMFEYLFTEQQRTQLQSDLANLNEKWKLLRSMKNHYEAEPPRDICKICYEVQVKYALQCGHVYCGQCTPVEECALCRQPVLYKLELFF